MSKTKKTKCIVPGCINPQHAKGYCNTHYGQLWRKGKITPEKKPKKQKTKNAAKSLAKRRKDRKERLETLERELNRAQNIYNIVVGFEGRMKWRKEMEAVQKEINKLMNEDDDEIMDDDDDEIMDDDDDVNDDYEMDDSIDDFDEEVQRAIAEAEEEEVVEK